MKRVGAFLRMVLLLRLVLKNVSLRSRIVLVLPSLMPDANTAVIICIRELHNLNPFRFAATGTGARGGGDFISYALVGATTRSVIQKNEAVVDRYRDGSKAQLFYSHIWRSTGISTTLVPRSQQSRHQARYGAAEAAQQAACGLGLGHFSASQVLLICRTIMTRMHAQQRAKVGMAELSPGGSQIAIWS